MSAKKFIIVFGVALVAIAAYAGWYWTAGPGYEKPARTVKSNHVSVKSDDSSSSSASSDADSSSAPSPESSSDDGPATDSSKTYNADGKSYSQAYIDSLLQQRTSTPIRDLKYYQGQQEVVIPMTDGSIDAPRSVLTEPLLYSDGAIFWTSHLTIDGQKQEVVAEYSRQGYFAIYTKEPTSHPEGFTYNGNIYDGINNPDLDQIASQSKHYY